MEYAPGHGVVLVKSLDLSSQVLLWFRIIAPNAGQST